MNILVAPDKFRGSLEAAEVCEAAKEGILLAFPNAEVVTIPLADGGEGTAAILTRQAKGTQITATVSDPLGRPIKTHYGISPDGNTAFIEMAAASGLAILAPNERNPLLTSTFGTGELILDALSKGVKKLILGIGGSATTDGGTGMAAALGYRFFDQNDKQLDATGGAMQQISRIDISQKDLRIDDLEVIIACDVTNPLYGKNGAAHIYGPQKGADAKMVESLDAGLRQLADVASKTFNKDIADFPGAGAAGGLGAGCLWFLNAKLRDGVSIVMEQNQIAEKIREADLVITGEGKVDEQTLQGKVVAGLAGYCQKQNVPLAAICGTLLITPDQAREAGITYVTSVLNRPMDLATAQEEAFELVKEATFQLVRLFFANNKLH